MKNILLPTDFSDNSLNAIDYAADMLKDVACKFYILNIQKASSFISDDFRTMSPSATIYESLIATAKTSINEIIIKLEARNNPIHEFEAMVDYDNFVDAIDQACAAKSIDLIIMGTKGATGAEKVFFGSNTVRVMQRCSTPVLAVPEGCNFTGMKRIVFTSNYHTLYNKEELIPLVQIAELFSSNIDILHVVEEEHLSESQENNKAFLDASFRFVNHEFVDLNKKDLFDAVKQFIDDNQIQLLAMMSRHHTFLERLFTRHAVETFGFKLDVPMLVMENTGTYYD